MKKPASQDNAVAYAAAAVVLFFAIGFAIAWNYRGAIEKNPVDIAYSTFGPFRIQSQGFAFRTSVAIQTRAGNAKWAEQNKGNLDNIFQKILTETDPATLLKKDGLQPVQDTLRDAINTTMNTDKVQAVLVTDFLMVASDE